MLCFLLAAPAAYAHRDTDDDWGSRSSYRHHYEHRHDAYEIQRKHAKLEHAYEERQRALRTYNHARRVGDWDTMRFEHARLEWLDRKIEHDQRELHHAYKKLKLQRDHYERPNEWRERYGFEYDRF